MASNSELARLRSEALAKQRAVTKKISRLKNVGGVSLSGSDLDPRKRADNLKKLNTRQLNVHVDRLESFLNRKTQYVPDKAGRAVDAAKFRQYKALETTYNARVNANFDRVKDLQLPSGRTIEERFKLVTPDRRSARGVAVNAPYDPPVRTSSQFKNEKALNAMIRHMQRRLENEFPKTGKRSAKRQTNQIAKRIKDATGNAAYKTKDEYDANGKLIKKGQTLGEAMKDLSVEQFKVLWNYTTFSTDISIGYEEAKKLMSNKEKDYKGEKVDAHGEYAHELIAWAKKLKL